MRVVFETNSAVWDKVMDDLVKDDSLSIWVPELTARIGLVSDNDARRVLRVIDENKADFRGFTYFVYGRSIESLSDGVFQQWIDFLLAKSDEIAISIALDLYAAFYLRQAINLRMPEELTFRLITHPVLFNASATVRTHQFSSYHWEQISTHFIHLYPDHSIVLSEAILKHFGEENSIFGSNRAHTQLILATIARQHPDEVWRQITQCLTFPLDSRAFHITRWLRGDYFWREEDPDSGAFHLFPKSLIWQWVDEDVEQRAWFIADFAPPQLHRGSLAREILIRYGKRDDAECVKRLRQHG